MKAMLANLKLHDAYFSFLLLQSYKINLYWNLSNNVYKSSDQVKKLEFETTF